MKGAAFCVRSLNARLASAGVLYTIGEIYGHSSKADASLAMTKRYVGREQLQRMRGAIKLLSLPVSFTARQGSMT
jgi:hypothetical protein